ncbi:MAG: hypothetical protein WD638_01065 [Nitriliruptoraceae bacterium]
MSEEDTPRTNRPRAAHLVAPLDPVTAVLAGALPYHEAPIDVPDGQAQPGLRLHREVTAPGCTVRVTQHLGDELLADQGMKVDLLPLDRARARPRRRVHPAPQTVLTIATDPDGDRQQVELVGREIVGAGPVSAGTASGVGDADTASGAELAGIGGTHAFVPQLGPGPDDIERIAVEAGRRRLLHLAAPLAGDPVLTAALLLRVVAGGTPCVVAPAALAPLELLHADLRAHLAVDLAPVLADDLALARLAADQRRAAWQHHDRTLSWAPGETDGWQPRLAPPRRPTISVLLATRRPALVPFSLQMLAAQRDVEVEVIVALHGGGEVSLVEEDLRRHGLAGSAFVAPPDVPFGAVLQAAVDRSHGALVTKWDDDDLYGPEHLLDLVLAQRQTAAALVGKAPEFVYLQSSGTTVWRTPGRAEAPSVGLAGGTFLTPREALDSIGGYPPVARAVDHHLKMRLQAAGELVFRTHGFGFVLRRHGAEHTWEADDDRFLGQAVATFDGLPEILGLGDAVRFEHLDGLVG